MSDDQLLRLAEDIEAGQVFTMGHLPLSDRHLITSIFSDVTSFNGRGLIYQYWDKAIEGVAINDYPIFAESCILSSQDIIRTFTLLYSGGK